MSAPAPAHQATLFLPDPVASLVNDVRSTWDPEMAGRIHAHITLVHDVSDLALVVERIRRATEEVRSFRLTFGAVACWGSPEGGIYVEVRDVDGGISKLREHVMSPPLAEPAGVEYVAHVTLVHPRTASVDRRRDAWERLRGWRVDREVVIDEVTMIREDLNRWTAIETIELR